MSDPTPNAWSVEIVTIGRCGTILYREGPHAASFGWEFGGGDVVAIIAVGLEREWDDKHPWASGRRDEVLNRMVGEVIRRKARTCEASFDKDDEERRFVLLREQAKTE